MLQLKKINKTFKGMAEPVLKEINLTLHVGEFCVVIGANGSGKSTLMKVISGECEADSGKLEISHTNTKAPRIAQVTQDINKGTVPELTLLENVALSLMRKDKPAFGFYKRFYPQAQAKLRLLELDLEPYMHLPLHTLSGGQRQMVATLMAIDSGAPLLLLDEHTSALDPKMQARLMAFTARAVADSNLTTLMITHSLADALQYGNRLIVLQAGQIVMDVAGVAKAKITLPQLVDLFHQPETAMALRVAS